MSLARRVPASRPASTRDREHAQRQRRERQPRLHRVVLERHLQEDREGDHRPAQRDLLQRLLGDPEAEVREPEQVGVEQRHLARRGGAARATRPASPARSRRAR